MEDNSKANGHEQPVDFGAQLRALESMETPLLIRALETSVMVERSRFARMAGLTFDGKRDEYEIFGYDRIITNRQYRDEYDRGGIAGRVVDVFPNATWRGGFEIIEDEDPNTETAFEKTWIEIEKKFKLTARLMRVDKLAGLGDYAVILIGARGSLSKELPKATKADLGGLLYFQPFSGGGGPGVDSRAHMMSAFDAMCTVQEYETDPQNERFGLPKIYQLRRPGISTDGLQQVHWSRIIHIAEGCLENDVFGQPALERVWNLLIDLRKVTGGGAEAFWLRANQGMQINIDKDMAFPEGGATAELEKLKVQAEEYQHEIRRILRTRGVDVKMLGSDVANFANPADAILTQIAGSKGIPKRILTGSEMGELASTQDRENWRDQVVGRQKGYAAPFIIQPLVDRLIEYGYLPAPKKGPGAYEIKWTQIETLSSTEKAAGATQWAQVNAAQGEIVFTPEEIRDVWYGMEPLTEEQRAEIAERQREKVQQAQEMFNAKNPALPQDNANQDEMRDAEDNEMAQIFVDAVANGAGEVIADLLAQSKLSRLAGGAGSGNFGHAGRPGEVGGSAPSDGSVATIIGDKISKEQLDHDRKRYDQLKAQWALLNNKLLYQIDDADSPEARKILDEQKALVKEMYTLNADPGGLEGVGLPGGPRDIVVVGGGPGGMAAAIMGGTDGLDTLLIEAGDKPGGQAKYSSRVENLPGFPIGVSGEKLATKMFDQVERVGVDTRLGTRVTNIDYDFDSNLKTLTLSNGEKVEARTVIIAGGIEFRRGNFQGADSPDVIVADGKKLEQAGAGKSVVVIGGSNGAAQAALGAARTADNVLVVSRSSISKAMSDYQVSALHNNPKIKVIEGGEIASVNTTAANRAHSITLKSGETYPANAVGLFIGGRSNTDWLPGQLRSTDGKVVVNHEMETNMPGVFAIGDMRQGGLGRIGAAIGDGQQAERSVFNYFERQKHAKKAY